MRARGPHLAGIAAAAVAALSLAAPAQANHHLVKIAEVYPGTVASPNVEYVELEMTSSGQNLFGGSDATMTLFDADGGTPAHTELLSGDLTNGQRGRRVLVSVTGLSSTFPGVSGDYLFNPGNHLSGVAGAACFKPDDSFGASFIDCVSWGGYSGTTPSPTGTNVSPGGTTDGQALDRERGECVVDLIDTNAAADWAEAAPSPLSNASPPATDGCPETEITKAPKARGTDRTPKIKFVADPPAGATFECTLDGDELGACASPLTLDRLALGKYKFKVVAVGPEGTDPTPATAKFKIVRG